MSSATAERGDTARHCERHHLDRCGRRRSTPRPCPRCRAPRSSSGRRRCGAAARRSASRRRARRSTGSTCCGDSRSRCRRSPVDRCDASTFRTCVPVNVGRRNSQFEHMTANASVMTARKRPARAQRGDPDDDRGERHRPPSRRIDGREPRQLARACPRGRTAPGYRGRRGTRPSSAHPSPTNANCPARADPPSPRAA